MTEMSAVRRRTDRVIREGLLKLLEEKPLNKITVQDLCQETEINRATFYRYYTDIYALYDAITHSFLDELFTNIVNRQPKKGKGKNRLHQGVMDALDLIEHQKSLCYKLFQEEDHAFAFWLVKKIREVVTVEANEDSEFNRLRITYMCGGILSIVLEWIRNDCKPEKEIVAQVVETGLRQVVR